MRDAATAKSSLIGHLMEARERLKSIEEHHDCDSAWLAEQAAEELLLTAGRLLGAAVEWAAHERSGS